MEYVLLFCALLLQQPVYAENLDKSVMFGALNTVIILCIIRMIRLQICDDIIEAMENKEEDKQLKKNK